MTFDTFTYYFTKLAIAFLVGWFFIGMGLRVYRLGFRGFCLWMWELAGNIGVGTNGLAKRLGKWTKGEKNDE